jgi:hypothetical protein
VQVGQPPRRRAIFCSYCNMAHYPLDTVEPIRVEPIRAKLSGPDNSVAHLLSCQRKQSAQRRAPSDGQWRLSRRAELFSHMKRKIQNKTRTEKLHGIDLVNILGEKIS